MAENSKEAKGKPPPIEVPPESTDAPDPDEDDLDELDGIYNH